MNSPGWARTSDLAVNSRSLYQLSYGGINCETKASPYLGCVKSRVHIEGSFQGDSSSSSIEFCIQSFLKHNLMRQGPYNHLMHHFPIRRFLVCLCFVMLTSPGFSASDLNAPKREDPFRIEGKPPMSGYVTGSELAFERDLMGVEMIAELGGLIGEISPRSFSTLGRSLGGASVEPGLLSDASQIAVLHLHRMVDRQDVHVVLEIHQLVSDETGQSLVLRSIGEQPKVWSISREAFVKLKINLPMAVLPGSSKARTPSGQLARPYVQSKTQLDLRTVRARIRRTYPKLTRELESELFRVRLPMGYNPEFPAGVLVWISPNNDGRIPRIFEPILDRLGLIALGVDNNSNKRSITDRLQCHLDSIETLASHYRIDRKRVYLTGMSGGGRCSGILQIAFPELFAGAVPIVGFDTYHNAKANSTGGFWAAGLGKPAGKWMKLLKTRRIAGITGSVDYNLPEMKVRKRLLKDDGIEIRLDVIEGMGHAMPKADEFADALDWVDGPRRSTMVADFKRAKEVFADYLAEYGQTAPTTPAARKALIRVIVLAPWTEPAIGAAKLLGYE